jgi:hypothetical protein
MAKNPRTKSKTARENSTYRILDDVLALAGTLLRSRREYGAGKLHSLAEATRGYAVSMTDLPQLRAHVAQASESIEGFADYVMHTDIDHMVQDAAVFARRQPIATLGVAIAAGMVATRLMRTSGASVKSATKPRTARKSARKQTPPKRKTNGSAQAHA